MGAELCLAHDIGGVVEALGPPFGRHAALRLFHWDVCQPLPSLTENQ